jgi:hypothetical protein
MRHQAGAQGFQAGRRSPQADRRQLNEQTTKGAPLNGAPFVVVLIVVRLSLQPCYHDLVPWQEFEQLCDEAFQPMVLTRFLTPFM